jgi:hypothetical protein
MNGLVDGGKVAWKNRGMGFVLRELEMVYCVLKRRIAA